MKLNLGCGEHKIKGYINCDILEEVKPDIRLDLTKKLPFADNSIDEIYMNHVLEHILNYGFLLNEIWRVCKKNSKITIRVPFYASQNNLQVPEHINSFGYFSLVNYSNFKSNYAGNLNIWRSQTNYGIYPCNGNTVGDRS